MTDLTEAVRACAEWMGWRPADTDSQILWSPCDMWSVHLMKDDLRELHNLSWLDHFTARILDKLEAEGKSSMLHCCPQTPSGKRYDFTVFDDPEDHWAESERHAEAIIRATAAYLKARQQ